MASKQILKSLKINSNFCEINPEYPSLSVHLMDRHLCTTIKPLKTTAQSSDINKILNTTTTTTTEQHEKNSKNTEKETEVIDLFQYQQQEEEEIHNNKNKIYRKCRHQLTNSNNDKEIRDNTN